MSITEFDMVVESIIKLKSRDTFYRYQELVETDDLEGLIYRERRVPNLKNRVDEGTEEALISYTVGFPA